MRKIYFSVLTICTALSLNAQQTIGFESFTLEPNSFDEGANANGGFVEYGIKLSNKFTHNDWGNSVNGFTISNLTDTIKGDYNHPYNAITASGHQSTNYAVYFPEGTIEFDGNGAMIDSFKITNTAYAYGAMKNGNLFSKKFGSSKNAKGEVDSTGGNDYFRVWVYAHNKNEEIIDSTVSYLADFRFEDSTKDYILDSWKNVDLSFLKEAVFKLSFKFESSDTSGIWLNTPEYFAIDDLSILKISGLNETKLSSVSVYPNPFVNEILVKAEGFGLIELFDVSGKQILATQHTNFSVINVADLSSGAYTVRFSSEKGSLIQKIVK